jgi:Mg/Co/Ni transporter MgtE
VVFGPQFRTSDEAQMFVTTANDVGGFFAFLSIATLWFGLR